MAMIKGMDVVIVIKKQVGESGFGEPVYEYSEEVVKNVLVAPSSTEDIISSQDLYGKKAVYTLAIPKGDMHIWENTKVKFFGRTWRTIGIPLEGMEANIPLNWNKKVTVELDG